ncbi:type II toxin-antitoxin system RelE/ParE family toxin [Clostridium sp.]|uniref:type II toxin-antitoxin system RelE/ParE family toxin n=1 Tax=Clostridium sp. TaxID=1506 RepID=UPI0039E8FE0A
MAKSRLEILAPAWRELDEIASYYLLVVGSASARKITDKILDSLARLEDFPLSCAHVPDIELKKQDYRMLVCDKYVCIYRLIGEIVYVYHIAPWSTEYSNLLK